MASVITGCSIFFLNLPVPQRDMLGFEIVRAKQSLKAPESKTVWKLVYLSLSLPSTKNASGYKYIQRWNRHADLPKGNTVFQFLLFSVRKIQRTLSTNHSFLRTTGIMTQIFQHVPGNFISFPRNDSEAFWVISETRPAALTDIPFLSTYEV